MTQANSPDSSEAPSVVHRKADLEIAGHPSHIETIVFGRQRLRLVQPLFPDSLCDSSYTADRFERDEFLPYWADLWPASELLASYLLSRPKATTRVQALEIGCGLGLVSVAADRLGWSVLATDYEIDAVRFAHRNAHLNACTGMRIAAMDWRRPAFSMRFDRLLAADVLYEKRWHEPVVRVVCDALQPDGEALIAEPGRVVADGFAETARSARLRVDEIRSHEAARRAGLERGVIYRLRRDD